MARKSIFELLSLNRLSEVKNELLLHGKGPKPVCPIFFFKDEKENPKQRNDELENCKNDFDEKETSANEVVEEKKIMR